MFSHKVGDTEIVVSSGRVARYAQRNWRRMSQAQRDSLLERAKKQLPNAIKAGNTRQMKVLAAQIKALS